MYSEPTLNEQVAATLKVLGLCLACPEEGAAFLNESSVHDS